MKAFAILLAILVVGMLVGCKGGESAVIGKWKASASGANTNKDDPGAKFAEAFLSSMTLEFKSDHTFSMTMLIPIEGTWSMSGSRVSLQPTSMMGISGDQKSDSPGGSMSKTSFNKPMELELQSDGTLKAVGGDTSQSDKSLIFKKEG